MVMMTRNEAVWILKRTRVLCRSTALATGVSENSYTSWLSQSVERRTWNAELYIDGLYADPEPAAVAEAVAPTFVDSNVGYRCNCPTCTEVRNDQGEMNGSSFMQNLRARLANTREM